MVDIKPLADIKNPHQEVDSKGIRVNLYIVVKRVTTVIVIVMGCKLVCPNFTLRHPSSLVVDSIKMIKIV